ncbi:hypothetical protein LEMLEM_LOCUS8293 [Lemmus lemmus]
MGLRQVIEVPDEDWQRQGMELLGRYVPRQMKRN